MQSFFPKFHSPSALIFGAPETFEFARWIIDSDCIRAALAFGHQSGWQKIEEAVTKSRSATIELLFGQAFFQTEPKLLYSLRELTRKRSGLTVKLASATSTFHPKVWIITQNGKSQAIVGSSNLSSGGLTHNVECNLYTDAPIVVHELSRWFKQQWELGHALNSTFVEKYVDGYNKLDQQRVQLRKRMDDSEDSLVSAESNWRRTDTLERAIRYWKSDVGIKDVRVRSEGIKKMREILVFPSYALTAEGCSSFITTSELGHIRPGHIGKTISDLPSLQTALRSIDPDQIARTYDQLDRVKGIGRNLASKLLAVHDPETYIVVNGPVEKALVSFGFPQKELEALNGDRYVTLLRKITAFIEEARDLKLWPAAALDAFFFHSSREKP